MLAVIGHTKRASVTERAMSLLEEEEKEEESDYKSPSSDESDYKCPSSDESEICEVGVIGVKTDTNVFQAAEHNEYDFR